MSVASRRPGRFGPKFLAAGGPSASVGLLGRQRAGADVGVEPPASPPARHQGCRGPRFGWPLQGCSVMAVRRAPPKLRTVPTVSTGRTWLVHPASFRVLAVSRAQRIRDGEMSAAWVERSLDLAEAEGREGFASLHRLTLKLAAAPEGSQRLVAAAEWCAHIPPGLTPRTPRGGHVEARGREGTQASALPETVLTTQ